MATKKSEPPGNQMKILQTFKPLKSEGPIFTEDYQDQQGGITSPAPRTAHSSTSTLAANV